MFFTTDEVTRKIFDLKVWENSVGMLITVLNTFTSQKRPVSEVLMVPMHSIHRLSMVRDGHML